MQHSSELQPTAPRISRLVSVLWLVGACALAQSCFVSIGDQRAPSRDAGGSVDASDDVSSDATLDAWPDVSLDSPLDAEHDATNDAPPDTTIDAGPPQPLGRACKGSKWSGAAGANRKRVNRFVQLEEQVFDRMLVYVRNTGADAGSQSLRGVIYTATPTTLEPDALVAVSDDVTIDAGKTESWVTLTFDSPVTLKPGEYWIGFHSGATQSMLYRIDTVTDAGRINTDNFADGTTATFGTTESLDLVMSIYLRPVGVTVDHDEQCTVPP